MDIHIEIYVSTYMLSTTRLGRKHAAPTPRSPARRSSELRTSTADWETRRSGASLANPIDTSPVKHRVGGVRYRGGAQVRVRLRTSTADWETRRSGASLANPIDTSPVKHRGVGAQIPRGGLRLKLGLERRRRTGRLGGLEPRWQTQSTLRL